MKHQQASFAAAHSAYRGDSMNQIAKFMPLVRRLAWHMHGSGHADLDVEDLVQTGLVALTECVTRHGNESEDGFAAYVKLRVKGAMIDQLRRSATLSRGAMGRRREMRDKVEVLEQRLGRTPTSAELAEEMNLTAIELAELRAAAAATRIEPLDDCYSDHDPLFADETPDAFDFLCDAEARARLGEALERLEQRHQLVVQLYFVEELNLAEIAAVLGVSIPRVHQIKAQALNALREKLSECQAELLLV